MITKIEAIVESGKATAGPPIGPALGPLKVDIPKIISEINKKTSVFLGMKIPIKIIIDTDTKDFEIEIGTPPISELIKKECKIEKGSGIPNKNIVGNLAIEQVIKLAKMKYNSMLVNNLKSAVKSVIGSCYNLGVYVEGKKQEEIMEEINSNIYDNIIIQEKTEASEEKLNLLKKQLIALQEEYKKEVTKIEAEKALASSAKEAPPSGETKSTTAKESPIKEEKPIEKEEKKIAKK